jgi:hypothetical protein
MSDRASNTSSNASLIRSETKPSQTIIPSALEYIVPIIATWWLRSPTVDWSIHSASIHRYPAKPSSRARFKKSHRFLRTATGLPSRSIVRSGVASPHVYESAVYPTGFAVREVVLDCCSSLVSKSSKWKSHDIRLESVGTVLARIVMTRMNMLSPNGKGIEL